MRIIRADDCVALETGQRINVGKAKPQIDLPAGRGRVETRHHVAGSEFVNAVSQQARRETLPPLARRDEDHADPPEHAAIRHDRRSRDEIVAAPDTVGAPLP